MKSAVTQPAIKPVIWRWWFVIQGVLLVFYCAPPKLADTMVFSILAVIEGFLALTASVRVPRNPVARFFYALNFLLQITAYPLLIGYAANQLLVRLHLAQPGLAAAAMVLVMVVVLVMHLPYAMILFAPLQGGWSQAIAAVYSFAWILGGPTLIPEGLSKTVYPAIGRNLFNTTLYGAFLFLIIGAIAMRQWGYRLPSWRLNPQAERLVLLILLISCLLFLAWNTFSNLDSFRSLFVFQFRLKTVSFYWFAQGLEPGLAEEWLFRYIVLALLLTGLRRSRWQIPASVLLTGLLFGVWHSTNVFAGQSFWATASQVQFAIIAGWFLAALYLYTGSFIVPMLFHAAIDILGMMASASMISTTPTINEYLWSSVMELIYVLLTLWLLTGRRRASMQWTVDRIVPPLPPTPPAAPLPPIPSSVLQ
ncbi:CPBP family intramembrane glutamic endopeptidase [Schleiferilactobacillus shenzhenensis]|uniref:CAAX prenyl protease 2/Lysostaphin resistance protein A-like domain-containing protein n=1 Tax=Schleiferilactobacillus shenzhenensis LY-73 TaxID=1231336 RepID=U4TWD3_9LACO|nr:CPBP family intramembrane glutamic endopeptidase [Schleiferilactobacillus shenzhenensis]ERL65697.1 hypothetical protein L248_2383 [Schleiferilactobacillus shenzhenensis LY-73]